MGEYVPFTAEELASIPTEIVSAVPSNTIARSIASDNQVGFYNGKTNPTNAEIAERQVFDTFYLQQCSLTLQQLFFPTRDSSTVSRHSLLDKTYFQLTNRPFDLLFPEDEEIKVLRFDLAAVMLAVDPVNIQTVTHLRPSDVSVKRWFAIGIDADFNYNIKGVQKNDISQARGVVVVYTDNKDSKKELRLFTYFINNSRNDKQSIWYLNAVSSLINSENAHVLSSNED